MHVLLLSDPGNPHTIKWAKALASSGLEISIYGLVDAGNDIYAGWNNIHVYHAGLNKISVNTYERDFYKLFKYTGVVLSVRKLIHAIKPDIVHAHFASSYGLLGALSGFHPYILSVWGYDVFQFPKKSFLHKTLLQFNFKKADRLLSTSRVMAQEAGNYTHKNFDVTPFGIDLSTFKKIDFYDFYDENDIVIGTVKSLDAEYGIEYLIRAFSILKARHPNLPLKLLIVGGGNLDAYLKKMTVELSISEVTRFTGKVDYKDIHRYQNMLSIAVYLSNNESFGVSVIESSACEKPVVVSNVGGLPEVVEDGVTGFIVPPRCPEYAANALERLVLDKSLRENMGKAGRSRVERMFNFENNLQQMINIYNEV